MVESSVVCQTTYRNFFVDVNGMKRKFPIKTFKKFRKLFGKLLQFFLPDTVRTDFKRQFNIFLWLLIRLDFL